MTEELIYLPLLHVTTVRKDTRCHKAELSSSCKGSILDFTHNRLHRSFASDTFTFPVLFFLIPKKAIISLSVRLFFFSFVIYYSCEITGIILLQVQASNWQTVSLVCNPCLCFSHYLQLLRWATWYQIWQDWGKI